MKKTQIVKSTFLAQNGKTEEMYQMAWRVLRFNEKVVSPATKEMKWKAKKIEEKRNYGKQSLPK